MHSFTVQLVPSDTTALHDAVEYGGRNMWKIIGDRLGLSKLDLEAIQTKNQLNVAGYCFQDMLQKWFQSSPNCYLHTFLSALRSDTVGLDNLCLKVQEAILIEYSNDRKRSALHMNGN